MFKEYIQNDILNSFINNKEFAEQVNINGVMVTVIEDSDKLEYRIKTDYNGLVIGDVLFYIDENEYSKIPKVTKPPNTNQVISYNRKPCIITNVNSEMGVYEIVLQSNGGY